MQRNWLTFTVSCVVVVLLLVHSRATLGQFDIPHFPVTCHVKYQFYNNFRTVNGHFGVECGEGGHSAPFGNWGVNSNYSSLRDGYQFPGWKYDDNWYQWNSCTARAPYSPPSRYNRYYNYDCRSDQQCYAQKSYYGQATYSDTGWMAVSVPGEIGTTCSEIYSVMVFNGLTMAVYELDVDWPFGNLHGDSDHVATLIYPQVSIPVTFSGNTGSGTSGWVSQTATNISGVQSSIKVKVSVAP